MLDIRQCYTCGDIMHYRNYLIGSNCKVQREHFTYEMIKEIWNNSIFVIKCCKCFFDPKEFVIHEIERIANIIKKRRKKMGLISW